MAMSVRKQMVRRCRLSIARLVQTEEALCQIEQMAEGRSETLTAMIPVILRSTELLKELWEKTRAAI